MGGVHGVGHEVVDRAEHVAVIARRVVPEVRAGEAQLFGKEGGAQHDQDPAPSRDRGAILDLDDPVLVASQIVVSLQSIVSRTIGPLDSGVITVGSIHGGAKHNIIGDRDFALSLFEAMIPLGKKWFSQCGIHLADDDELLRLAVRSGCGGLFVGLESLSQENLSHWTKGPNRAEEYVGQVRKLHENGIAVYAGFVFGSDGDSPDVFQRTLDFLDEAKVDALQATRLTPFPGTPLFDEMDGAGRIFDKDWSHYDFRHCVIEPARMSARQLQDGADWLYHQFYHQCHILVDDRKVSLARIHLSLATKFVLQVVLDLIGVDAPESMGEKV